MNSSDVVVMSTVSSVRIFWNAPNSTEEVTKYLVGYEFGKERATLYTKVKMFELLDLPPKTTVKFAIRPIFRMKKTNVDRIVIAKTSELK